MDRNTSKLKSTMCSQWNTFSDCVETELSLHFQKASQHTPVASEGNRKAVKSGLQGGVNSAQLTKLK